MSVYYTDTIGGKPVRFITCEEMMAARALDAGIDKVLAWHPGWWRDIAPYLPDEWNHRLSKEPERRRLEELDRNQPTYPDCSGEVGVMGGA